MPFDRPPTGVGANSHNDAAEALPFMNYPFYTGWRVLAGSFVCAALAIGFVTYTFGMFVVPVTEEFGISRASFNNGVIAFMLGMGIMSPFVGRLLDRFSARKVMVAGAVSFGVAMMLASRSSSLWQMLLLIFVLVSFGSTACGILGANTVVVRWFERRRGRALGILALCTSVGGFVAQPLAALLIESFGWRDALFLLGLIGMTLMLTMIALAVRNAPTEHEAGWREEFSAAAGSDEVSGHAEPETDRTWGGRQLLGNRDFWFLALAIGLLFGADQAVLVSQVAYFQGIGYDLQTTAMLVSIKTISAVGGKLVVGWLADKVDLRLLFTVVASCNVLLMTVYILQPSFWIVVAAVSLLGVAIGGVFPVWTTMMARIFGPRSYGTVMGMMIIIMQPFAVLGLRFIGEVYDRSGSYTPAFAAFIGLVIIAIALIWMVRLGRGGEPVQLATADVTG